MNCPLNDRRLPEDDKPVSEIIAEYAEDQVILLILKDESIFQTLNVQDKWVNDFIEVFEKMVRNGYQHEDLTAAPGSWENIICTLRNKVMSCQ